ncbi:MAG: DUF4190 domain-containing protein [Actinotalea sp.]|nr:DUF4190 domain-containing protein [Actinotalea sp.]
MSHATPDSGAAPAGAPVPPPRTEPLAVVSIISAVLGLSALPGLGSLLGVVTGHLALRRIRTGGLGGEGLAKGGLVVGYIGLAIAAAVLIGIGFTLALRVGGA